MKIAVLAEADGTEPRVAATPETVKKFIGLGAEVVVQAGAGKGSALADGLFKEAGATIGKGAPALKDADIVLGVRRPSAAQQKAMKTT